MLKLYSSIEETRQEIKAKGLARKIEISFNKYEHVTPEMESLILWLFELTRERKIDEEWTKTTAQILCDLASNAYRHGVRNYPENKCEIGVEIGEKGFLFSSRQYADFLTPEQIQLLKASQRLESTTAPGGGAGTMYFTELCQGIFIEEADMSLYLTRFFPEA